MTQYLLGVTVAEHRFALLTIECLSMAQKSKLRAKYFLRYWLNSFICARTCKGDYCNHC